MDPVSIATALAASAQASGSIMNALGGSEQLSRNDQLALAKQNQEMQYDFAKNGLSWRVADAKAAGLHPLAALGAASPGFSPVTVMPAGEERRPDFERVGQNLGRAALAMASPFQKLAAQQKDVLELKRLGLENDLLEAQIRNAKRTLNNQPGTPPGVPSNTVVTHDLDGTTRVLPSAQASLALMAAPWERWNWWLSNRFTPSVKELKYNLWDSQVPERVKRFLAGSAEDYVPGGVP